MDTWQQTVAVVSERIFPGLTETHQKNDGNKVISSVQLQMSLYFNVVVFPVWLIIMLSLLDIRYYCLSTIYQFVFVTCIVAIIIIEVVRLYLGYSGNLTDNMPDLAGFWMLSVLLQFPLQSFLLFDPHFKAEVVELVLQATMVLLLMMQICTGYIALRAASKHQALQFQIQQTSTEVTQ